MDIIQTRFRINVFKETFKAAWFIKGLKIIASSVPVGNTIMAEFALLMIKQLNVLNIVKKTRINVINVSWALSV